MHMTTKKTKTVRLVKLDKQFARTMVFEGSLATPPLVWAITRVNPSLSVLGLKISAYYVQALGVARVT